MDERRDIKNVKIITKHSRERKKEVEKKANSVSNKQSDLLSATKSDCRHFFMKRKFCIMVIL